MYSLEASQLEAEVTSRLSGDMRCASLYFRITMPVRRIKFKLGIFMSTKIQSISVGGVLIIIWYFGEGRRDRGGLM